MHRRKSGIKDIKLLFPYVMFRLSKNPNKNDISLFIAKQRFLSRKIKTREPIGADHLVLELDLALSRIENRKQRCHNTLIFYC